MKKRKHEFIIPAPRRRGFTVRAEYSADKHGFGAFDKALHRAARGWSEASGFVIGGPRAGIRDLEWPRRTREAADRLAARLKKVAPRAIRVKVVAA